MSSGNAWKYTGTRETAVIEVGVTDFDGVRTYFVRDNGVGLDMAAAKKIFTPFKRLPGAEKQKGFGIGLATVERIILRGMAARFGRRGSWARVPASTLLFERGPGRVTRVITGRH